MRAKRRFAFLAIVFATFAAAPSRAADDTPQAGGNPPPPNTAPAAAPKEAAPPPSVTIIGARDAHGVLGRVAASGVRQQRVAIAIDPRQEVVLRLQVDASQRDGHDLRTARLERGTGLRRVLVLPGADNES